MDKNERISIILKEWSHTCFDGCCYSYGTDIYLNNEKVSENGYEGTDVAESIKIILSKLGYTNIEIYLE